ncbi:GerAB/ArcD/ProY family transporter [Sediminibacillus halophilus]|uniref:Spore germination protein (Amino acid permease) n=1 Tax=Sediminibacillus halophilus TaxID=482461 RepID=A0A1G9W1K8_9BACI|nr:endospore germination permease [Sediminibacillus halophilus]SDM78380.1 spore germination protein (amino acid permease) [Sediminibacillus halophilus]
MARTENKKISRRQFFFIIIQTQIGVGVLSLPFDLHQAAKQDGWISFVLAGLCIQLLIVAMWLTARQFPDDDLISFLPKLFGNAIGKLLSSAYYLYFVCVCVLILVLFGRMLHLWILPNTPFWVLAILLAFTCLYLISSGLLVMARIYTFVSILLVIIFLLLVSALPDIQLVYLLPVGQTPIPQLVKGAQAAVLAMLGYISFFYLYPHTKGTPAERLKTMSYANLFVILFYLFVVFVSFTYFSTSEITFVPQPVLYLLKAIELHVISRVDLFLLSMWIVSVATSFSTYLFMASKGLTDMFHSKKPSRFAVFSTTLIVVASLIVGIDEQPIDSFTQFVTHVSMVFSNVIPLFLMLYTVSIYRFIRRKRHGKV